MGKLLLSGGGNAVQSAPINKHFVEQLNASPSILYIPIAGDPSFRPYEECLDYVKSMFNPLGVKEIEMWTDFEGKTLDDLKQYSGVYMSGGDPLRLLEAFKATGFSKVVTQYFEGGGIIYGQSAGALILCETIAHLYVGDDPQPNPNAYTGLELFKGKLIWCHYTEEADHEIKDSLRQIDRPIVAIPNGTALYINNLRMKLIGNEPAYFFESESKRRLYKDITSSSTII
ncbi:Type 1 glutamine amidotransferase-like domain-containing protein [Pseudalkalibacillus sp. Hm43]|uniref:Type 1 glutamine amidotransferase-like domain-containing protein n=1 Tax=Pseudalkalibacillus sp. Hm43 TaxID=3450742 RepID=UPI003F434B07